MASNSVNLNVAKSGDLRVDALLHRHKWTTPTITYSFFDDEKGGPYYNSKYKGIKEITGTMKSYLRHILEDVIEPLINVDFVEVQDTKDNYGQIRYMFSTSTTSASTTKLSHDKVSSKDDSAGDVRFSPGETKNFEEGPGAYRYESLIHETLHALGMKHPGDYNKTGGTQDPPFLASKYDNSANSVLSYNRLKALNPNKGAITPMTYDILALQYLYGAKAHEAGDTTYKFKSVYGYTVGNKFFGNRKREIKQTLWDSGGNDTFDFSGLAFNKSGYRLDLTDGGWITTKRAYQATSYKAEGDGKKYKTTAYGTKSAIRATIENLVNSTSDDTIIANSAANIFSGYNPNTKTGNDTIINSNGRDQLDLSGYKSANVTQTSRGKNLVLKLGNNGSITVNNYYAANKNDRLQILMDGTRPTPTTPTPGGPVTQLKASINGRTGKDISDIIMIAADNSQGAVNGKLPGQAGYLEAALSKATVVFSTLQSGEFKNLAFNRILDVGSGQFLQFAAIKGGSLGDLQRGGRGDVIFAKATVNGSTTSAIQPNILNAQDLDLSFRLPGGARFQNFKLNLTKSNVVHALGSTLQGQSPEHEMVDLRGLSPSTVKAAIQVFREADFNNSVGFYTVEDEEGSVKDPITGKLIRPGSAGYLEAALANRVDMELSGRNGRTNTYNTEFATGKLLSTFLVVAGAIESLLDEDAANNPTVFFNHIGANSDNVDHVRLLGDNVFGYEDITGGGDMDFDDMVVKISFA